MLNPTRLQAGHGRRDFATVMNVMLEYPQMIRWSETAGLTTLA